MTRRPASVLAALTILLSLPAAAHAIPGATVCPQQAAFRCATVTVPVDRTGGVGGQIGLKVAYQPGSKPVLVALTGGPGQPGVARRVAGQHHQVSSVGVGVDGNDP